ncbi:MAG: aconitate hydratase AcnA [Acidobacteria bacterium]|nr:aconitate hydratase AcnA [Acidobacteriota bacterium]MDA1233789.1 aconitate hydratase AcnA [Acidobacteriota bacterium]
MNSFGAKATLSAGGGKYEIFRLGALDQAKLARLPYSLKILLENLLRNEDGLTVKRGDIDAILDWEPQAAPNQEIAFRPARVLMQDFTGVPAVVDLAAMREAMKAMGGDPARINPLQPAELVIDHSVQVDRFASPEALKFNTELEYTRNRERYQFLKWGQHAFDNFKVVPPETGIVHQVNVEYLARVVFSQKNNGVLQAYPDTLVGTDSHTTMVNGLGVLGWGVGGIEAEAAMLGQPISMLIPQVVGFKLKGKLPEGATATDLVLMVTERLREKGVVGKFVEFYGTGLSQLSLADRATLGNMAPEFGSTCGIFPIDDETLRYLRLTGRPDEQVSLVEAYAKEQGMFRTDETPDPAYTDSLELDLSDVEPSLAGPRRPQDRVPLRKAKQMFAEALPGVLSSRAPKVPKGDNVAEMEAAGALGDSSVAVAEDQGVSLTIRDAKHTLRHGSVVIAAITSCTNTSNPAVMMAAGLVAKKAVAKGLQTKAWVKTSLAPGSKVVTEYLRQSGLLEYLDMMGFNLVGYGCTTCIGNSGPLPQEVSDAVKEGDLAVCAVLSGNRNFEGRIHPEVRMNYLASPPLVVAYALAGRMDIDLQSDSLGTDLEGEPVYLKDIWPSQSEIQDEIVKTVTSEMFKKTYANVFQGEEKWASLSAPDSELYDWDGASTYIRKPPFFVDMAPEPTAVADISGARVLALLGDSVTTDHISPAGAIKADSPAGKWLQEQGVQKADFNSYGSRRGNHEVMMRGTFANVRLRNQLAPGTEGSWTELLPGGERMSIYDASMKYQEAGTPLVILGGKEYGSGSSRDWAAKGTALLGARAVLVESYERIHRSNLIGMGVLPLQFLAGESVEKLGLSGRETFDIVGMKGGEAKQVTVRATPDGGAAIEFQAAVRIDTPQEVEYYKNGGILQYVLRQILKS